MFPTSQISFGGGELSPEVRARIDIEKYALGCKTLRNFFVRVSGGANNRTGTEYVSHVKNDDDVARLIPFSFNVEQTYELLFQEGTMRVIKDGALVIEASNPITGATAANPVNVTSVAHGFDNGEEVFISGVGGMIELNEIFFTINWILATATTITGATAASPVVITDVAHGYSHGDRVYIDSVIGMTELNGNDYIIERSVAATTTITGATQANPVIITDVAHGYSHGDSVYINSIVGMTEINDREFVISRSLGTPSTITAATQANPVSITDTGHPYSTSDVVYISGVVGMTEINGLEFTVTVVDPNTYTLGVDGTAYTAYTSGGQSELVEPDEFGLVGEDGTGHTAYASGGTAQLMDLDEFYLSGIDGSAYTAYTSGGSAQKIDADNFTLLGIDGTAYTAYTSGGTVSRVFNLVTPYLDAEIFDIDFTQSNDVMTLVHPNHDPRNVNRLADDNWTITVIDITPDIATPTGAGVVYTGSGTGIVYDYVVTAFNEETGEESVASTAANVASGDLSTSGDKSVISWSAVTNATEYNIYKAEDGSGFYGYIGSANALTFTDRNITPEFTDSPALSIRDPFSGANDKPSTVDYFQGRRWFASSDDNPVTVWGSVSGAFANFNVSKAVKDDDSVTATLSSKQANAIRHMVPLGQMVVFTSGSEWLMSSSGTSSLITPSTVSFSVQSYWGSDVVEPIVIGNAAIFLTGNKEAGDTNPRYSMVRDIKYTLESDNYNGTELSVLSSHLFENRDIVSWDYAQIPYSLVWAVRDDGVALSMTYVAENRLWAWARHDTTGNFEDVSVIREGGEDAVYFVVKRKVGGVWKRFIERLHTRQFDTVRDWFGVDSGVSYDDPKAMTGATQANPVVITAAAHGFSNADKIDFSDVIGMTELNGYRYQANNVTTNTFELQTDEATPVNVDGTAFTAYESGGNARKALNSFVGLDHLEGLTVIALCDGNVVRDLVVTSGAISTTNYYSRVHAGLSYTCDLETLDANVVDKSGVVFNTTRKADGITFRLNKTRGGEAGSNEKTLYPIKSRTNENWGVEGDLVNEDIFVQVESAWKFSANVFYRQSDPLPTTILSVIIDLDKGDD